MTKLTLLDASKNKITDISPLMKLVNLRLLNLKNNNIENLGGISELRLYYLNLANNKLSNISSLFNMYGLTDLYLEGNNIEDISYLRDITTLNILNLTGNNISDISVVWNFTKLTHLYLGRNNISNISPIVQLLNHKDTRNLKTINLSNNKIKNVDSLKGLDKNGLIDINLASNPIEVYVPADISDVINTEVVSPVWGEGTKEDPIVLNVNEGVTIENMENMIQTFKNTNTVCESIEVGQSFTTYRFKVTDKVMLMRLMALADNTYEGNYFSLVVSNSDEDLINLLNTEYNQSFDDAKEEENNQDDEITDDTTTDDTKKEDSIEKLPEQSEDASNSIELEEVDNESEVAEAVSSAAKTGDAAAAVPFLASIIAAIGAFISRKKK